MLIDKNAVLKAVQADRPTVEDRSLIAKYLKSVGGCPHQNKWHNPGYADSLMKCLDCGQEDV